MALEVIMPKAGVDMTEGQIVQWNKKVGEFVKEGEILLEIMTDKVSMELEAEEDGYLIAILKVTESLSLLLKLSVILVKKGKISQQLEQLHQKLAQHLQQVLRTMMVRAMMLMISLLLVVDLLVMFLPLKQLN